MEEKENKMMFKILQFNEAYKAPVMKYNNPQKQNCYSSQLLP
jgi:hypothetical protein